MKAPIGQNVELKKYYIDHRSAPQKFFDSLAKIEYTTFVYGVLIALNIYSAVWIIPLILFFLMSTLNLSMNTRKLRVLPLRLPTKAGNVRDYHSPKTAERFKFKNASGNIHLGNELFNRQELWEPAIMLLTHLLVVGSTGAGKTQMLLSLNAASSLMLGGAVLYVDAKAFIDVGIYFLKLARIFGREDSLRFMSFRTGNQSIEPGDWQKFSNTVGIFAGGSASVCTQILEDMMPEGGQNQVFKDKAISILKGFMPCATELRDKKVINLSPYMISQLMTVSKLIELAWPELFDYKIKYIDNHTGEEIIIPNEISLRRRRALQQVLIKLGIKTDEKSLKEPSKQPQEVGKQFSYADGYIVKPLVDFGSTYGHLFECELGEVDTSDIMKNNHILITYIPATETSKDQRQTQGRISLSMIRLAISNGMGKKSEGHVDDILFNLPIDKTYISTITVDEYAECAVVGFAVTSTQARGFGVSMIFSNQDIPGMLNASVEETKQIFGNTRIKYLMTMEDPNETIEWFSKLAGEMSVLVSSGRSKESSISYIDNLQGQVETMSRLNFLDIKGQEASEAHVFEGDKLVRAKTFYHGLPEFKDETIEFIRQLEVKPPTKEQASELRNKYMAKRVIRNMLKNQIAPKSRTSQIDKGMAGGSDWIANLLNTGTYSPQQEDKEVYSNFEIEKADHEDKPIDSSVSVPTKPPKLNKATQAGKVVQTEKNRWVYGFKTSPNLRSAEALAKSIADVAQQAGVDDKYAEKVATEQSTKISDSLKYTSQPISPEAGDEELFWKATRY